jgi:hypothetical protein
MPPTEIVAAEDFKGGDPERTVRPGDWFRGIATGDLYVAISPGWELLRFHRNGRPPARVYHAEGILLANRPAHFERVDVTLVWSRHATD